MPIGIVSSVEFEKELGGFNEGSVPTKGIIIETPKPGRKTGDFNVPDSLRKVIAETSIEEGSKESKKLAAAYGISGSSVSAYKVGAKSTASYDSPDDGLRSVVKDTKIRISSKAKSRLLKAIQHITDDKLEGAKVRDLAGIAKDLATVVKVMEPETKEASSTIAGPTFVFYTPPQKKEEQYETLLLKE
jgi:hypothetical protein